MSELIEERTEGYRRVLGTEHPITTRITRVDGGYLVTAFVCNGVADGSRLFPTLEEARRYCGWDRPEAGDAPA